MDTPDLPPWLANGARQAFGTVARVRDARGLHPRGATFSGDALVTDAGRALATPGEHEIVVRLSRGIGLPHPWPDFNGVAVRFVDGHGPGRHQDVLVTSSFSPPIARHAIFPWPSLSVLGYSSVLTFDTDDGRRMLRIDPLDAPTLETAQASLPLRVLLCIGEPTGSWAPAATLRLRRVLSPEEAADVRFDPWTTADRLRPRGLLNRLRGPAYEGSRQAAPRVP